MSKPVFQITSRSEYKRAGEKDLLQLVERPGDHPICLQKWTVEDLVRGITHGEVIHVSGPTGTAKTAMIESVLEIPENFRALCLALGAPVRPVVLHTIPMVVFDSPADLWQQVQLVEGSTIVAPSMVIEALRAAEADPSKYHVVWFRELGRTFSPSVQGGLLDLIGKSVAVPPSLGGGRIDTSQVSFLFDSNYLSGGDVHVLSTFDDALKRRPTLHILLDYLPEEQEQTVVEHVLRYQGHRVKSDLVRQVVALGATVRRLRREGQLSSCAPPTIHGYLAFFRHHQAMPHRNLTDIARATVLPVGPEDDAQAKSLCSRAFGFAEEATVDTAGVAF